MTPSTQREWHSRRVVRFAVVAWIVAGAISAATWSSQPARGFDAGLAITWAERLAAPDMRGRRTGTPDGDRAARIVADEFRAAGLEPAGDAGTYLQSFPFPFYQIVAPARLAILRPQGAPEELSYARDYFFLTGSGTSDGEADVVFAGYGLDVDRRRDYATLDVKGRIVLALEGAPAELDLAVADRTNFRKARDARQRGARGLLLVPAALEAPLPRDRVWVLRPENYQEGFLFGRVSPAVAGQLTAVAPTALRSLAESGGALPAPPTRIAWRSSVVFDPKRTGANVLGKLTGRDAALRDEAVILGAHYDGGGVDPDGTIYPGAEDNVSGTSVVLALARTLALAPRPARTVLLAAWGAEEQGAWGSKHFADSHPRRDRIAATFTLDNVGVGDGTFRLFGALNFPAEWALLAPAIPADLRAAFKPRGAGGSDGWTFQILGIPSFFAHAAAPQPYVHTPRDEPATLARVSLDNAGRFMAAAVAAAANAPTSFVDGRRLDRYLARHGFIAGYTRASRPDWPALRRRGFDLVLWERPSGEAGASTSTSPDVVMVRGRDDLSDTEEGQPLRVLVARLDGTTLTFGAGAAPWRRIEGGWDAGSLTVRLIGAPSQVAATSSPDVGFVLDADSDVQVDEVTGALVGAGRTAEDAEALLSGRVRDALLRAIPPRRADHAQSGADQEGISALLISRRFSASITSPGTPR